MLSPQATRFLLRLVRSGKDTVFGLSLSPLSLATQATRGTLSARNVAILEKMAARA